MTSFPQNDPSKSLATVLNYVLDNRFPSFSGAEFIALFNLPDSAYKQLEEYLCLCKDGRIRVRQTASIIQWKWGQGATFQTYIDWVNSNQNSNTFAKPR